MERQATLAHAPPPARAAVSDVFRQELIQLIPFLRAFARTLCGNRDEADDLCQEALVKAWQSSNSFEPGTNLKAWLFMILRNHFYSTRRRSWRQQPLDEGVVVHMPVTHETQNASLNLQDLSRALRLLPDEQREALILVGAGGFSCADAARICNCAVGTIKSRVARARKALIGALEGHNGNSLAPREHSMQPADEILGQLEVISLSQPATAEQED